jgi:hypothetical protein
MRFLCVAALTSALAGCAGGAQQQTDNGPPPNARGLIAADRARLFKDPDSIRDAQIGTINSSMWGWQVCLRANAKNGFGGYGGQTTYIATIYRNGSPILLQAPTIYDICSSDIYSPFPEIEGGYTPPAPAVPPATAPNVRRAPKPAPVAAATPKPGA